MHRVRCSPVPTCILDVLISFEFVEPLDRKARRSGMERARAPGSTLLDSFVPISRFCSRVPDLISNANIGMVHQRSHIRAVPLPMI
jgi:hypothetical protein